MNGSRELTAARVNKKDEFYTPMELIVDELQYYKDCFKGKTVYCNCDDPRRSMFFKYFYDNFEELGIKSLISTCYIKGDHGILNVKNSTHDFFHCLEGDGSYNSDECLKLLDKADIVVTNPPFSLFRPFLKLMFEKKKDFLVLGHITGIQCIPLFTQFKNGNMRFGVTIHAGDRKFYVPDDYELEASGCGIDSEGKRYINVKGVRWFTTLPNSTQDTPLELVHSYYNEPDLYQKYDKQDAINIVKTEEIPFDYEGIMGVPITFLDKFCKTQFQLLGTSHDKSVRMSLFGIEDEISVDGKEPYERVFVRNLAPRPSSEFVPIVKEPKKRARNSITNSLNDSTHLTAARANKSDEFYTQMVDIEKEIPYYKEFLSHKSVYCNCDNPEISNFAKYFMDHFDELELESLIVTGYNPNGNGKCFVKTSMGDVYDKELSGNGDFRSRECLDFLKVCNVVVTNPPFSMFREYLALLMENHKKFLIIGNINALTSKDIFPLIRMNKIWFGPSNFDGGMYFDVPDSYEYEEEYRYKKSSDKGNMMRVSSVCWYTNIEHSVRSIPMKLTKRLSDMEYRHYENYNAIEVSRAVNIPMDYDGVIGVPITFLGKYCPDQFEIIGLTANWDENPKIIEVKTDKKERNRGIIDGKTMYARVLIRNKHPEL